MNQLAANLTTQVRAIAEVATAVTKGDLTRSIMVEAQGEVAVLKDNINEMIRNLRDTIFENTEQDWLKTNLANFTRMLQGHRDLVTVSKLILSELAPLVNVHQGVFYTRTTNGGEPRLELLASYASTPDTNLPTTIRIGDGLVGQCAYEKKQILLEDMPHDYIRVNSGLGSAAPLNLIILPVLFEGEVKAVIELASFKRLSRTHVSFLGQLTESIGIVSHTIEANMRTEHLLAQSQSLTRESCKASKGSSSGPTTAWSTRRRTCRSRKGCSRSSRRSCSGRTSSSTTKRCCFPSRWSRWSTRTRRSSTQRRRSRRRPNSWR